MSTPTMSQVLVLSALVTLGSAASAASTPKPAPTPAPVAKGLQDAGHVCRTCGTVYWTGTFCPEDATRLTPVVQVTGQGEPLVVKIEGVPFPVKGTCVKWVETEANSIKLVVTDGLLVRREVFKKATSGTTGAPAVAAHMPGIVPSPVKSMVNGIGMKLVFVPSGKFTMGSAESAPDEAPAHPVTLAKGFWMGTYEVTQAEWLHLMGKNPSKFNHPRRPVECVSWDAARKFCRRLSAREKRQYRLPSEAEWEYACRAGTTTDQYGPLSEVAWHLSNSGWSTHEVGQLWPNRWGLYDMLGNVWEWCQDSSGPTYKGAPADGRASEEKGARFRVYRGGAWDTRPRIVRASNRCTSEPVGSSYALGFRVVLEQ